MQERSSSVLPAWVLRGWPHVRAALILALCGVAVVAALPSPGPSAKKLMKDEAGQQELRQWVTILGNFGWHTDEDTLADQVMVLSKTSRSAKSSITKPFRPFFRLTGTWQGWGLFAYPDTHPHSMIIEVAPVRGDYEVIYDSRDPELRWMGPTLHFRRVRALYNPGRKPPAAYRHFVEWLSTKAFEDYPDAARMRVSFVRERTAMPWEEAVERKTLKRKFRRVHTRSVDEEAP